MIGSIIGVSQTDAAIPRILERFGTETKAKFPNWEQLPFREDLTMDLRERSEGIYSWQPKESRTALQNVTSNDASQDQVVMETAGN